jgi:hypothetical protein
VQLRAGQGHRRRGELRLVNSLLVCILLAASAMATTSSPALALPQTASPADKHGVHLTPDPLRHSDFVALEVLRPRYVVVLSGQLGDPDPTGQVVEDLRLERWLRQHQDVQPILRMWPVKSPEPADQLAARIVAMHKRYPWIHYVVPANEPDIEWGATSWDEIGTWTADVWRAVDKQRSVDKSDIRLLFPPFAQQSELAPELVGYDAVRASIELYLDHGDGIAAHEYWDRANVYLVEDRWPDWLRQRLRKVPFLVTECGRQPLPDNGVADAELGAELVAFARRTRASVVSPFVLSSAAGTFEPQALVDSDGVPRGALYGWAQRSL